MKSKVAPVFVPKGNQVVFDYWLCKALMAFASKSDYHPRLQSAFVSSQEVVATDGHALIRVPWKRDELVAEKSWLVHRDAFTMVRRKKDRLSLNLASGELRVHGEGAIYPIKLKKALQNPETGGYPEYQTLLDDAAAAKSVSTFAVNPELLKRAMAANSSKTLGIVIEVPENTDGTRPPHIERAVPFRTIDGRADGLLMPMRIID
ncbi:MAG: hypothetical protein KAJ55_00135 [Anaerolineales bacterium]|nr:hypothetical protein [Anaerolineales bacterium]